MTFLEKTCFRSHSCISQEIFFFFALHIELMKQERYVSFVMKKKLSRLIKVDNLKSIKNV